MARHDAERGVRRALVDVKAPPDAEHDAQKKQRKSDAYDSQHAAALVAKSGFGDKTCKGHEEENILYRTKSSHYATVALGIVLPESLAVAGVRPARPKRLQKFCAAPAGGFFPTAFAGRHPRNESRAAACGAP